ncbi:hypothetical protein IV203_022506 [Nitzschia inconspicua]|uniref:Uncharacterized protein n=1 Tax=Nitzschia inconspicua TaxID=303405 RepID=A0A9K3KIS8_9STRA|nr:hypothetical protein IV203_022506 [Nitzschia inconspicua]
MPQTTIDTTNLDTMVASLSLSLEQEQQQQSSRLPQLPQQDHPLIYQVQIPSQQQLPCESSSKPFKQVRFGYVTIRNYDITMGDNPAVTAGPPIQLDWEYEEIPPLPVRDFEYFKLSRRGKRSAFYGFTENKVLTISPDFRTGILLRAGFSDWEIAQTMRNLKKLQQQRTRTAMTFPFYRVEYAVRSAGRKLQRSMGGTTHTGSNVSKTSNSKYRHRDRSHDDEVTIGTIVGDDHSVYEDVA